MVVEFWVAALPGFMKMAVARIIVAISAAVICLFIYAFSPGIVLEARHNAATIKNYDLIKQMNQA